MNIDHKEAYSKSLKILKECSTPYGFKAATETKKAHYSRVWGRDSMICSLAALISGDKQLISQVKASLLTLMKYQSEYGLIPSNVDVENKKVSYGQSAGRVDSTLWFLIIFSQYVKRTKDLPFLLRYYSRFRKSIALMHLYEFNERHFIYVPKGGDWADEYIHEGYVLYDQILYYRAMIERVYIRRKLGLGLKKYSDRAEDLRKSIVVNFWPEKSNLNTQTVYQNVLYKRALKRKRSFKYLLSYFNPSGYGFQFDGFGNSLALLFDILPKTKQDILINYINNNFSKKTHYLLPAFYPPIKPHDPDWEELKDNYYLKFSNHPNEYHNGGLWPMITGFYAAAVAGHGDKKLGFKYLDGVNLANYLSRHKKKSWEFSEHLNAKTMKPLGTKGQAWSAAAGIIAYHAAVEGKQLFI